MRRVATGCVLGALVACGSTTTPTVSGVFPAEGFTGRATRIEISGDATSWQEGATVDLGADVEVDQVEVASPTDVFATITIAPGAALGHRDVTVTSGGTLVLKQAFELVPPVELQILGNAGQGGRPDFRLVNHDFDHPFDTTQDPQTGDFANLVVTGPDKVRFAITSAGAYLVRGRVFIDLDAASGPVSLASGPASSALASATGTITVESRHPTPITSTTTGAITSLGDTALYSLSATGSPSFVHVAVRSDATAAAVGAAIFTDTSWSNVVGLHEILPGPATVAFVVADVQGSSGYVFDVSAAGEPLASAAEGNDATNGTMNGALVAGPLPFLQTGGTLSSASDTDLLAFTVSASTAQLRAHVITDGGPDPATDTKVDITDAAGTSMLQTFSNGHAVDGSECGIFGCFPGDNFGEDAISDPLPAGTYYLRVTPGASFDAGHAAYSALIWLE